MRFLSSPQRSRSSQRKKLKKFCALSILCGVFFLTGCNLQASSTFSTAKPTPFRLITEVPNATITPTAFRPSAATETPTLQIISTPTSTPIPPTQTDLPPTESPPPTAPNGNPKNQNEGRPQYELIAELDYAAHILDVDETITYTNQTGVPLDTLVLNVEANRWGNCFNLKRLRLNGLPATLTLNGARMEIPLGMNLQPQQSVILEIAYLLNIPPKHYEEVFGYVGYQTNLVNWYPFVAPYSLQKGWQIHEPSGVGEHLVYDASDFDVRLKVKGDENLIVAASAEGNTEGNWTRYELNGARTFALSISPIFNTQTEANEQARVTSFYFQNYENAGKGILEAASKAIEIYSDRFAPYPYESLSIVQTQLADGMEYDGLIFMGSKFYNEYNGTIKNNLISIGVHEVSHQWWFGMVGNDQALEPWLDEAMALYSERIFYEEIYPYPVNWWWRFRVTWFSPSGWVDTTIYDGYGFRGYTNSVYLRGAQFLEAIRFRIGEKAFNAFLKDFATTHAQNHATTDSFFEILDQNTDINYSDIVDDYFNRR